MVFFNKKTNLSSTMNWYLIIIATLVVLLTISITTNAIYWKPMEQIKKLKEENQEKERSAYEMYKKFDEYEADLKKQQGYLLHICRGLRYKKQLMSSSGIVYDEEWETDQNFKLDTHTDKEEYFCSEPFSIGSTMWVVKIRFVKYTSRYTCYYGLEEGTRRFVELEKCTNAPTDQTTP